MLIANRSAKIKRFSYLEESEDESEEENDLKDVEAEARLVGWAARICGLCPRDQEPLELFNLTGQEIVAELWEVVERTPDEGKIFIWYVGHAYAYENYAGEEQRGTLIHPSCDRGNFDVVHGVLLENSLMHMVEKAGKRGVKVWANLITCRVEMPPGLSGSFSNFAVPEYWPVEPSNANSYYFFFACEFGRPMMDSPMLAHAFCYNLGSRPDDINHLEKRLNFECQCMTFGDLRPQIDYVGSSRAIPQPLRLADNGWSTGKRPYVEPDWLDSIRKGRLLSYHFHLLALEELPALPKNGHTDAVPAARIPYEKVRNKTAKVLERFHRAGGFKSMEQQLWLLSRNTLDEVEEALQSDACASSSSSSTVVRRTWTPRDGDYKDDMRVVLNVPDDVLRIVFDSVQEARNRDDFNAAPLRRMLMALGAAFTAHKFLIEEPLNGKGRKEYIFVAEGASEQ